jgi:hypothetical protein
MAMPDMFVETDRPHAAVSITIKKRATADEIQADLQRRIDRLIARDEEFRSCTAPRPYPSRAERAGAPNWTVNGFPGLPSGGYGTLVKIVDQARSEYELVT